jgi:hypothetical protein
MTQLGAPTRYAAAKAVAIRQAALKAPRELLPSRRAAFGRRPAFGRRLVLVTGTERICRLSEIECNAEMERDRYLAAKRCRFIFGTGKSQLELNEILNQAPAACCRRYGFAVGSCWCGPRPGWFSR